MAVTHCHVCDKNPAEAQRFAQAGYADGAVCPICQRPTCRYHLVMVRWRWRTPGRELDSAQVCRECKRAYKQRNWDPLHREWIS
jgi:hypothetical protein